MDVSNLVPAQGPANAGNAVSRTKAETAPLPASGAAPVAPAVPSTPRPANAPTHVADRVERSPELQRRVADLRRELERGSQAARERAGEVAGKIREAMDASHETLLRAAVGILRGELYFFAW